MGANLIFPSFLYSVALIIGLEIFNPNGPIPFGVIFAIFLTAIYFVSSYFLYNQKIYSKNKTFSLMPGAWVSSIEKQSNIIEQHSNDFIEIKSMLLDINSITQSKEDLIKRYQEGYDQKIYKKFLLRYIKIMNQIKKFLKKDDSDPKKSLEILELLMEEALEDCGVEEIPIDEILGKKFIDLGNNVADNPILENTSDRSKDGIIKEVTENGYRLIDTEKTIVLKQAKVIVMKYKETGG